MKTTDCLHMYETTVCFMYNLNYYLELRFRLKYLKAKLIQINRIRITMNKTVKLAGVSDSTLSICEVLLMIKLLQRGSNLLLKGLLPLRLLTMVPLLQQ